MNKSSADLFTLDLPGRRELEARKLAAPPDRVPLLFGARAGEESLKEAMEEGEKIAGLRWSDRVSNRWAINNQPGDQLFN